MTADDLPDDLPEDTTLAIDVALGALDREALHAARLRMMRDAGFRSAVEGWQALLSPLADTVAPIAPPTAVWDRVAAETMPVAPVRATAAAAPRPSAWSSLGLWRGWALGATALAGLGAGLLLARPDAPAQPQLLVATLSAPNGGAMLTATYDAARGAVILTPAGKSDAAGRTPELWVIEGSNPPRSLGTIDIDAPESHAIPAERLKGLKAGSTLAISLEPPGGSPTGAPTGPVVATGKLTGI